MRVPALLRPAATLATAAITRRGVLLALVALAERILVAAAAWALFARPLGTKLAVSLALGFAFTVRTFLVRSFAARTEADLMDRAIACVLDGDALRSSVLPGEDAHAELGQGVYLSALELSEVLPALVADSVAAVLLTLVICAVEPLPLVGAATAVMVVAAVGLIWSRGRLQAAAQTAWSLHERLQEAMVDALEGRLELVASGERAAFAASAHERARAWGLAGVRMASSALITGRLPLVAIVFGVGIVVTIDSRIAGMFPVSLADVALFASVAPAFAGIGQRVLALVQSAPWVHAVVRVVETARRAPSGIGAPTTPAAIEFEAVSFRYDDSARNALTSVGFHWDADRVVALLGANGSGKSTCLHLLLALGTPTAGNIKIGGVSLRDLDIERWRRHIAFLPQRPYVPARCDVRAAVRFLAPAASDERILAALERVGLLDALRRAGGDPLAVRVDSLSIGQRQRVVLARMLCRDAQLVVLDEPDANLDREGITLVANLVRELSRDRRVIFAAHTPELIDAADRVIELDGGRIVRDRRGHETITAA